MNLHLIQTNKKDYLDLLLLADEDEHMIDKYIHKGDMYALTNDSKFTLGVCIVNQRDNNDYEIKNIAIHPSFQGQGIGKTLVKQNLKIYRNKGNYMYVGTGDSPLTILFYKSCGFEEYDTIKDFFTTNYKKPIFEEGHQLIDMIILRQPL
ncbi:GNAT family N-acetyltransferase [Staphylococcus massiliensis]|uniref:Acetyltransferase, gnat family protein n=1 Tax=Staphylococcus massiliensis S46 TaxID=1229783 RepID=K9ALL4_9STAP|nr:GNAT family N-acetyltransferase [Staphylococcus massiliensis]EKU48199.1 acetyltransferase, gnat family protein [Staphylococcus massiliensis S46]MCG3399540.1 GNAT family N-acetyltransferase [Staphylococcus massiliensis]MCG3402049.1 GNAT family N-acetyltransferase [Staphylococcus massiliensis]MCG3412700.1 GNAT family N-acetyltransferase [Staphylococcus massiliensis]POA01011.1 N-acetyltransferase [Staphylococcus massiliensis CCUG 55927]